MKFRILVWACVCLLGGCGSKSDRSPIPPPDSHSEAHSPAEAAPDSVSDLDRTLEELLAARCEHDRRTFECDECRYEVGFVRVSPEVLKDQLITVTEAALQPVAVTLPLTGEVRFDERRVAHVTSQVEGVIRHVSVALGERVWKGQPLIELESVAVGESQTIHREARSALQLARRSYERVAALYREKLVSEQELLQEKQALHAAGIRAAGSGERLSRLGSHGSGGRAVLRAPIDGTVLTLHAVSGEVARPDTSLVTVGDNTAVWVWADLHERDLAVVRRAQGASGNERLAAEVTVKAWPGERFPGTVDLIGPAMEESSRTIKVRIRVDNLEGRLLAGMFAKVQILLPGEERALAIPRGALLEDEGRSFVFVGYEGDFFVRRPVTPGRRWGDWVEISRGLTASRKVVAEGAFLLKSDVLRSKMGAGCAD